jgi:hypothetical protein
MTTPNEDVAAEPQQLSLFWQNIFVWLAGFLAFKTLMTIFEYTPSPAEISLIELSFLGAIFTLGHRHVQGAKHTGRSGWATLVDISVALVGVLSVLSAAKWGADWLAGHFKGGWRVAARILNADIVWLGCFLLAIYHPSTKVAAESRSSDSQTAEGKP